MWRGYRYIIRKEPPTCGRGLCPPNCFGLADALPPEFFKASVVAGVLALVRDDHQPTLGNFRVEGEPGAPLAVADVLSARGDDDRLLLEGGNNELGLRHKGFARVGVNDASGAAAGVDRRGGAPHCM